MEGAWQKATPMELSKEIGSATGELPPLLTNIGLRPLLHLDSCGPGSATKRPRSSQIGDREGSQLWVYSPQGWMLFSWWKPITETPSLNLLTKGPGFSGLSLFLLNLRIRSMKKKMWDIPTHTQSRSRATGRDVGGRTNIPHSAQIEDGTLTERD